VTMGGTVRTYDTVFRDGMIEKMHRVLKGITAAHGASYDLDYRKGYPSILNDRPLVTAVLPVFQRLVGPSSVIEVIPGMGGEDFSYLAQVSPGFYFRLGVANPAQGITAGVHTPNFDVDESCLKTAMTVMAAAVCDTLDRPTVQR
jgi:metal-dependent amidase/aminoacylase/carboxypeptidase family protein